MSQQSTSNKKNAHPPSAGGADPALTNKEYNRLYKASLESPEKFWGEIADELHWYKQWEKVRTFNPPDVSWFSGGKTNMSVNCLDRHLQNWRRNKAALLWEGEPGDQQMYTYQMLHHDVCKFANVLRAKGVKKGDRVVIYMGMLPELIITMLSCARIGAVHIVVFGGFSAEALRYRIEHSGAKVIVCSDLAVRRGNYISIKPQVDEAIAANEKVETVIIKQRTAERTIELKQGRDYWMSELMANETAVNQPAQADAEDPLFVLYASSSAGTPKGIVHTTGGYMVGTYYTTKLAFNLREDDVYWCTVDIGWMTGHSYSLYGPLLNGATMLLYEGAPSHPEPDRFWRIIEKYRVTIFYTSPAVAKALSEWGNEWLKERDLSSLRLLCTVGEPVNAKLWNWFHETVGGGRCPVMDTWWQSETGMIMLATLPGAMQEMPGLSGLPLPGVQPQVVDSEGNPVERDTPGYLVIMDAWPSMARTLLSDRPRYKREYWGRFEGMFFTGDAAVLDSNGYFKILGRIDAMLTVAGHRIAIGELEHVLELHDAVAEACVVGKPDDTKGTAIIAFVVLEAEKPPSLLLKEEIRNHAARLIGMLAKPDVIRFIDELPRNKRGKVLRGELRDQALAGAEHPDPETREVQQVLEELRNGLQQLKG